MGGHIFVAPPPGFENGLPQCFEKSEKKGKKIEKKGVVPRWGGGRFKSKSDQCEKRKKKFFY